MNVNYYDKLFFVDRYVVTRLQTGSWDQQASDEDIREMGNEGIVETIIDPNIPVSVTLNTTDWGSVDLLAQITENYDDSNRNGATIDQDDFKTQKTDILVRVRNNKTQKLHRSVWIPNATLDSIAWSYNVDGNATENYTFTADTDRTMFGTYRDAGIDIGTYATASTFTTNVDPGTSNANFTGLYVSINGELFAWNNGSDLFTWDTATGSGLVTVTAAGSSAGVPDLTSSDRIRLLYYRTTPGTTFTNLDTNGIGAVRGSYIDIKIYNDTAPTTYTADLQSVDINASFTRNDIKELGAYQVVDRYLADKKFDVQATITENDLKTWANMLGVDSTTWDTYEGDSPSAGAIKSLQDAIGETQNIVINIYDNYDKTNLLKTITLTDLALLTSPFSTDVGANGQVTFSLRSDNISIVGAGDSGNRLSSAYPTNYPYMGLDS